MDNGIIAQLRSSDPAQRKQAVIAAGNARDRNALPALNHLAETDPSPELRTLARRAVLYIIQQAPPQTPSAAGVPTAGVSTAGVRTAGAHTADARSHVDRAVDLRIADDNVGAAAELSQALALDSSLGNDSYVCQLASVITGLDAGSALTRLRGISASPSGWTCHFCRTTGIQGDTCPNCGAARDADQSSAASAAGDGASRPAVAVPGLGVLPSDVFLLNPEHKAFVTGTTRDLTRTSSAVASGCGVLFALVFLAAGAVLLFFCIHEWQTFQELSRNGVVTSAVVTSQHTEDSGDSEGGSSTTYYVAYRFAANGYNWTHSQSVSSDDYYRMRVGAAIKIIYSRLNPDLSQVGDHPDNTTPLILTGFTVVFSGVALLMLANSLNQMLVLRTLQKRGQMLSGQLTACKGHTVSRRRSTSDSRITLGSVSVGSGGAYAYDRDYVIWAEYTFETPKGKMRRGKGSAVRSDLDSSLLPSLGAPVIVLYADDSTYQML